MTAEILVDGTLHLVRTTRHTVQRIGIRWATGQHIKAVPPSKSLATVPEILVLALLMTVCSEDVQQVQLGGNKCLATMRSPRRNSQWYEGYYRAPVGIRTTLRHFAAGAWHCVAMLS